MVSSKLYWNVSFALRSQICNLFCTILTTTGNAYSCAWEFLEADWPLGCHG